jgi:acetyl esterase/lipase
LVAAWALVAVLAACDSGDSDSVGTTVAPVGEAASGTDVSVGPVTSAGPTRVRYGADASQFSDLFLPASAAPAGGFPVVVLIHGGFWRAEYGLELMVPLSEDLAARGFAVWNIEYRRVGQAGGGWPGTLDDVAAAIDSLAGVGVDEPLDLTRVALVGHSAGGHLALWAAGRGQLPAGAPGSTPAVLPTLAIGQGPVVDLAAGDARGLGAGAVTAFLGGSATDVPERYAVATPAIGGSARLVAVRGALDDIVPAEFTVPAGGVGVETVDVVGEDHFDLIDPSSGSWAAVVDLLGGTG